jgi:putative phosphoesterase
MRVALVSDSHVPGRAGGIPKEVLEACEDADMTAHAGDFTSSEAYDTFEATGEFVSVRGNMDRVSGLPGTESFVAGGVEFVMTHGTGSPAGYEDRVAEATLNGSEGAVAVCGHTHEVMDKVHDGVRLLNPGTCTGAPPGDGATMMLVEAEEGSLDVEVVEVDA